IAYFSLLMEGQFQQLLNDETGAVQLGSAKKQLSRNGRKMDTPARPIVGDGQKCPSDNMLWAGLPTGPRSAEPFRIARS
ncbi:MAG: hypothetical protein QGG71_22050, partial [Pirellulaceae bacterium]|nr:hypothetical protein [Pirellulaceae bacterium]